MHFRVLRSSLDRGCAARIIVSFRGDGVRALVKQIQSEVGQILSRDLDTVKIPSDIAGPNGTLVWSIGNCNHLIANAHVFRFGRSNRNFGKRGAGQLGNLNGIGNRASRSKRGVIDASGMSRNGNGDISRAHRQTNG